MTLRLDDETAAALAAVALVQGIPKADVVREALVKHLRECADDKAFRLRWTTVANATFNVDQASKPAPREGVHDGHHGTPCI